MAKGLRSKSKRRNRTEFRKTIGQEATEKNKQIVQEKLQECIDKGSMNSFARLSTLFNSNQHMDDDCGEDNEANTMQVDSTMSSIEASVKNSDKVPTKRRKIHAITAVPGQTGAKLARKKVNYMKRRGQMRNGQKVVKKTTVKKKPNKKLCSF
mmetsp:Transcript_27804/g.34346  ORF Transcript_27804/g.34346 Transcript_27804/m.34346 type:complete len:153 (-) Transcript_27804:183-641(-)